MGQPKLKPATYQDVLAAPADLVAEVVAGELHLSPRPGFPHARASSVLGGELMGPFDRGRGGPGGWVILDEPELHLGEGPAILVPDLAGWRRERMPVLPTTPFVTLAPDWVCEVLSTKTAKFDRAGKMPLYAREGVRHVWLVDPIERTLEVYRNQDGRWLLLAVHADKETVRVEPFDAVELQLEALWS
jgi:Uma2 family endonuclease